MEDQIKAALEGATESQLNKYGLDQKFITGGLSFMKSSRGNTQINLSNMRESRPTDEDKSRFLLTVLDVCKDAGITLSVSHSSRRTYQVKTDDGRIESKVVYEAWPSLWYSAVSAEASVNKAETAELKTEVTELRVQLAEMMAIMSSTLTNAAAIQEPSPAPTVGIAVP